MSLCARITEISSSSFSPSLAHHGQKFILLFRKLEAPQYQSLQVPGPDKKHIILWPLRKYTVAHDLHPLGNCLPPRAATTFNSVKCLISLSFLSIKAFQNNILSASKLFILLFYPFVLNSMFFSICIFTGLKSFAMNIVGVPNLSTSPTSILIFPGPVFEVISQLLENVLNALSFFLLK